MTIHSPFVLWFTGLSASGKTTISQAVCKYLLSHDIRRIEVFDGDVIRTNLSKGLGFSKEDRDTNILRVGWVAQRLFNHDVSSIISVISPYANIRNQVRTSIGKGFIEVYVSTSLEECEKRDPKGLYQQARAGLIKGFTGIDDPYESPINPELNIDTSKLSVEACTDKIFTYLSQNNYIK
ncbi:MAG: adenylyl-sulfate kinase [Spirochaetota bacterium]|nr:adenylyl-sulfate kinase [Spirochaetota bacterium]